jgi:hypothetical protein
MLEEFDCYLRFYSIFGDECVERLYQGISDTASVSESLIRSRQISSPASPVQFVVHLRGRIIVIGSHGCGDELEVSGGR